MTIAGVLEHYFGLFVLFALLIIGAVGSVRLLVLYLLPSPRVPLDVERSIHNGFCKKQ